MSLTAKLTAIATGLISSLGYGGLAAGLVVDSAGIPIPSEVLLPLSGALIRQGRFSWLLVILVSVAAQTAGAVLSYWIGASGGVAVVQRWGKYVLFSERELKHAHGWYERYGAAITFFGRVIPGVRTYIGYPAGIVRAPFGRFVAMTVAGSLAWTLILVWLGYQLSDRLGEIDAAIHKFGLVALGLLVLAAGWYVKKHLSRRKPSNQK